MAFNDWTEFPRRTIRIDALTSTPKTVSTTPIKVSGILVSNQQASAEVIRFRAVADTPEYFSINIPASLTEYFPIRAQFADMEVVTDGGADVDVTFFTCSDVEGTTVI